MKIKRFVVFAYYHYYPAGGWEDSAGHFDTREEAEAFVSRRPGQFDDYDIVDLEDAEIEMDGDSAS